MSLGLPTCHIYQCYREDINKQVGHFIPSVAIDIYSSENKQTKKTYKNKYMQICMLKCQVSVVLLLID